MSTEQAKPQSSAPGAGSDQFDLGKALGDLKIPGVDLSALVASQQKNFAALAAANKEIVAGVQQIAQRQADLIRQAVTEAAQAAKAAATSPAAKDFAAHNAQLAKQALDKAVAHLQEVSEIAAKAHAEVSQTVHKRVAEGLEEVRAILKTK